MYSRKNDKIVNRQCDTTIKKQLSGLSINSYQSLT